MPDIQVRDLTPQPAAAIRATQPMSELDMAALFGEHMANLAHRLADLGIQPAGPPYARYHEFGPERAVVEIGVPVSAPVPNVPALMEAEVGELGSAELPGGRVAILVHRGPYAGLPGAYAAIEAWAHESGESLGGPMWESYVDDPSEVAEADLRTEVIWPLG